jgi:leader peptidase (prepilin peptidase)/N-methyltransferase
MTTPTPIMILTAALIGACLGSFAATAALRSLRSRQALIGRSHCDACQTPLGFAATTPIVSFLALRGACGACGARIDPAHLAGEVAGALIAGAAFALVEPTRAMLLTALGLVLLTASLIDLRTQRLPDGLTLAAGLISFSLSATGAPGALTTGLIAAGATFLLMEALRRGFELLRRRSGLGFGDVKLLTALALWLGIATSWAVALAATAGLAVVALVRPADGRIAFGPLIAGAALIIGLIGEAGLLSFEGFAP